MTDIQLTLFCVEDGNSTPFSVDIDPSKTVDHLKVAIKTKKTPRFDDIAADELTLWRVSIPDADDDEDDEDLPPILLDNIPSNDKKNSRQHESSLMSLKKRRPRKQFTSSSSDHHHKVMKTRFTPLTPRHELVHTLTLFLTSIYSMHPSMHLSLLEPLLHSLAISRILLVLVLRCLVGAIALHAFLCLLHLYFQMTHTRLPSLSTFIKRITDKFFAPGPIVDFLGAFVKGEGALPITSGPIRGLPRAWRRGFGKAPENRPSLLFMDLPDPSMPDSTSRNHAAGSILELVKENNRLIYPVFGVFGSTDYNLHSLCSHRLWQDSCSLSQHWGFYFNASNDDWGSDDMMTLRSAVQKHLNDARGSFIVDREVNNGYARKTTLLLFLYTCWSTLDTKRQICQNCILASLVLKTHWILK